MKTSTRSIVLAALALAASAACAQATIDHNKALAGNVTPGDAAGYPITITRAGHYKLMGNLTVPAGVQGIVIEASGVTLDLNGFTVAGPIECTRDDGTKAVQCTSSPAIAGISVGGSMQPRYVVVRNGAVRGFGNGIAMNGGWNIVADVAAEHNGRSGMYGSGRFERVTVTMNGLAGLIMNSGLAIHATATMNGGSGILSHNGATHALVVDSVAQDNRSYGIEHATVRGTLQYGNGSANRNNVRSAGGNSDALGVY